MIGGYREAGFLFRQGSGRDREPDAALRVDPDREALHITHAWLVALAGAKVKAKGMERANDRIAGDHAVGEGRPATAGFFPARTASTLTAR